MSKSAHRIGSAACLAILFLRIAIGWHFYKEGAKKVRDGSFSSRHFLLDATGPWAHHFRALVDDPFERGQLEGTKVRESWMRLRDAVLAGVTQDDAKVKAVTAAFDRWNDQLTAYFQDHAADLEEYHAKAEEAERAWRDRASVAFTRDWSRKRRGELEAMRAPWTSDLSGMGRTFRQELAAAAGLAEVDQLPQPVDPAPRSNWVDRTVTWTVLGVGVCLLLGFLVPLASLLGAVFLLTVMASQPFWVPDANLGFAYYQWVEIAGLLVLATTFAGRFGGLDYFFWALRQPRDGKHV